MHIYQMHIYQSDFLPMLAIVRSMGLKLRGAIDSKRTLSSLRQSNLRLSWRAKYGDADVILVIYQYRYSLTTAGNIQAWVYTPLTYASQDIGPFMVIYLNGSLRYDRKCLSV